MPDVRLVKPAAGISQNIVCEPQARFVFDFPADAATLSRSGDNLVLTFDDGSSLQLENFYTAYSSENMPSFSVEGVEISGQDFFAAMNEPDLMPVLPRTQAIRATAAVIMSTQARTFLMALTALAGWISAGRTATSRLTIWKPLARTKAPLPTFPSPSLPVLSVSGIVFSVSRKRTGLRKRTLKRSEICSSPLPMALLPSFLAALPFLRTAR